MEINFKDGIYERLETDPSFDAGFAASIVRMYRKRIQMIRAASDERTFYAMKSLHSEQVKGKREGQYSMRLNEQWRLILEFVKTDQNKTVVVVRIEDYH